MANWPVHLTQWRLAKFAAIFKAKYTNAFSWMAKVFDSNFIKLFSWSALIQVMALCWTGDKPLSGPVLSEFYSII